jgi:hypothetical protein
MSKRDEEIAALRWAMFEAGKQKMLTTKLAPGGLARKEWRHQLATHERVLEQMILTRDTPSGAEK